MFILEENFTTTNSYDSMNPIDLLASLQEDMMVYSQIVIACMTEEVVFSLNEESADSDKKSDAKPEEKSEGKKEGFWAKVKSKVIAGLKKLKEIFMKIGSWIMNVLRVCVSLSVPIFGGMETISRVKDFTSKYPSAYADFEKYMKSPTSELAEKIDSEVTELNELATKDVRGMGRVACSTVIKVFDTCIKSLTKCLDAAIRISNSSTPSSETQKVFNLMVVATPQKLNGVVGTLQKTVNILKEELAKRGK